MKDMQTHAARAHERSLSARAKPVLAKPEQK